MGTRRRIAVRAGLAAYVAIAVAWLVSGWCVLGREHIDGSGRQAIVSVRGGSVGFFRQWGHKSAPTGPMGELGARWEGWTGWDLWYAHGSIDSFGLVMDWVRAPLWISLGLVGIPTALLWWPGRGPKPGHCGCGYDLAGISDGVCPECGASR